MGQVQGLNLVSLYTLDGFCNLIGSVDLIRLFIFNDFFLSTIHTLQMMKMSALTVVMQTKHFYVATI